MGSYKPAVLAATLIGKGVGIGVMGTLVALRGLTVDMAYFTALAVVVAGVVVTVIILAASENRSVLGWGITKVEGALQDHQEHDRAALQEAVRYNDLGTGPQPLAKIRRIGH